MTNYLKKHLLFIVLFCIILFALLFILLFNKSNNDIISNDNNIVNNTNNGMFAIMLETEAGSGEYQESKSNTWPGEGYIFNENLSVCENGSELTWNEELGAVNLKTNIADRCYVYFDVYVLPEILEVTVSNITSNSISLTVNAVAGTNAIQTYYYSINNGAYTSSSSNNHTFSGLSVGSTYNIRVYVVDTNGVESNIYPISASTSNLIEFTFTDYVTNITTTYYAEEDMTWIDFVNSEYNDGSFSIHCNSELLYKNHPTDIYFGSIPISDLITSGNYSNRAGVPEPCG